MITIFNMGAGLKTPHIFMKDKDTTTLAIECMDHARYACENNGKPVEVIQVGHETLNTLKNISVPYVTPPDPHGGALTKLGGIAIVESAIMPPWGYAFIGARGEVLHAGVIKKENDDV